MYIHFVIGFTLDYAEDENPYKVLEEEFDLQKEVTFNFIDTNILLQDYNPILVDEDTISIEDDDYVVFGVDVNIYPMDIHQVYRELRKIDVSLPNHNKRISQPAEIFEMIVCDDNEE